MKNNTKIYNRFKGFILEDCDCRYFLYYAKETDLPFYQHLLRDDEAGNGTQAEGGIKERCWQTPSSS